MAKQDASQEEKIPENLGGRRWRLTDSLSGGFRR